MATRKEWRDEVNTWFNRTQMNRGNGINFFFEKESDLSEEELSTNMAAASSSNPMYKEYTIFARDTWLKKAKKRDLDEYACHEVVHCVTSPLFDLIKTIVDDLPETKAKVYREWAKRENEEITTHLTDILVNEAKTWRKN